MKRSLLVLLGIALGMIADAQQIFSVGSSSALTVKTGTIFSADSLVLTPGADLTLSSNNLQVSHTAVNLVPAPSINRVYTLGSQINFTGTVQLYYQPSELNGNPESALKYTDSAIGSSWLAAPSSTVNTASHFVQLVASARNFIGATASHQGTVLALSLTALTAVWQGDDAGLSWTIDQSGEIADFTIERSTDGTHWTEPGVVSGRSGDGIQTYGYLDVQPPAGVLLYRLLIRRSSGTEFYSSIVKLQRTADDGVRLITQGHSVIALFSGTNPVAVRIINAGGAVIGNDRTTRWRYQFDGLTAGVYYLQYEMNGQNAVRGFIIQ